MITQKSNSSWIITTHFIIILVIYVKKAFNFLWVQQYSIHYFYESNSIYMLDLDLYALKP